MYAATAATKVKVTAVEDDPVEASAIERKLQSSGVIKWNIFRRYRGEKVFEAAQRSDIVSLDLSVEGSSSDSIKLANELVRRNPHQSLLFFTSHPSEQITLEAGRVVRLPGNFILCKLPTVWDAYDRLLLSVWIHDRCLAIIKAITNYYQNIQSQGEREAFTQVVGHIRELYPALFFLIDEVADPVAKRRYVRLRGTLHTVLEEVVETGNFEKSLRSVRRSLMGIVTDELRAITKVRGVITTTKLNSEIAELRKLIYGDRFLKTRVFLYESLAFSLKTVNVLLRGGGTRHAGRVARKAGFDVHPPPPAGGGHGGPPAGGGHDRTEGGGHVVPEADAHDDIAASDEVASVGPGEAQEAACLYLNAWFPEYAGREKLVVGEETDFLVNLGSTLDPGQMGVSDPISEDEAALYETVEYLDVMVICPLADVVPLRSRLHMPPSPERPARFKVVPRAEGVLNLTVILSVLNEPIHRTIFTCEAETIEPPAG